MKRASRSSEPPHGAALGHLAAAMSHEVRNPLNSMALHLELLDGKIATLEEPAREAARKSVKALQRDLSRIDDILGEYLRHVGPHEGPRDPVPIRALLGAAVERAGGAAAARTVRLVVDAPDEAEWALDPVAFGHALDEILRNAVDASPSGGEVIVRAALDDGSGRIEVVDQGEGIVGDVLPRIFALGFTTRSGRRGLGLAVAKQIVKGHGGTISARSDGVGHGTLVRIELPLD